MAAPLPEGWWKDRILFQQEFDRLGSVRAMADTHHRPEATLRAWRNRHSIDAAAPRTRSAVDLGEVELDVDTIGDVDKLLRERGMDPADWVVIRAVVNKWEGFIKNADSQPERVPMRQLKVFLRPKVDVALLRPAALKPLPVPKQRVRPSRVARLFFVYGDDQRPNVDRIFERLKLRWLADHQPDVILGLGDGPDTPTISGHKTNPALSWGLQECVNDFSGWLYAARRACPNAEMVELADNHFYQRLLDYQLARAAALYGVHPAQVDGLPDDLQPLLSPERLLRVDEIGVNYVAPPGNTHWAESQYEIVPGQLVAIHGYRTGQNLGKKFVDDYGCSVIYGHAHQQDVYVTDKNRRGVGQRRRLFALGVGCGAVVHGGGGFAPGADWQNSALTVSVFPDGSWTWDAMNYQDGQLTWRDEQYADNQAGLGVAA